MAAVFGLNQIISHGFGVFLFAALVPMMRETIAISHWHLATIGALTQLSYLAGALLLGVIGHRIDSGRLALVTGAITTTLLFTMARLSDPVVIGAVLICMAACAAISWGAIVEIISRHADPSRCSTYLSSAASGTAWGYGLNGLIILWLVPAMGWQSGWLMAGLLGLCALCFTWRLLRRIGTTGAPVTTSAGSALPVGRLLITIATERTALFCCLICFVVGFATMPFATWLNSYLDELQLPTALAGYSWTTVGATGMVAGFVAGKLADHQGPGRALLLVAVGFALGLLAFTLDPARFALLAGFGYGLMYFPMWGIIAGWLKQQYSSTATMQISGIGMVTFGLGGTLGNVLAGIIHQSSGSLQQVFYILTGDALLLVVLVLFILLSSAGKQGVATAAG
ncbi:MFS transporter [Marinobacterium arenosum]|uniref:MFS transporter n=1 Tax=Marinobacterium arenosum TaxID=2862496 RepID=UPI002107BE65|nr:MFS transporter [Marinobacterium arenosum]